MLIWTYIVDLSLRNRSFSKIQFFCVYLTKFGQNSIIFRNSQIQLSDFFQVLVEELFYIVMFKFGHSFIGVKLRPFSNQKVGFVINLKLFFPSIISILTTIQVEQIAVLDNEVIQRQIVSITERKFGEPWYRTRLNIPELLAQNRLHPDSPRIRQMKQIIHLRTDRRIK